MATHDRTPGSRVGPRTGGLRAAALAVALVVAGAAPAPLRASSPRHALVGGVVAVHGHGYGHGRGLGQWGAYGYARQGWSADQIVRHYYSGTTPDNRPNASIRVRIDTEDATDTVVGADLSGAGFVVLAELVQIATGGPSCVYARAVSLGGGDYRVECQPAFSSWQTVRDRVHGPVLFMARAPESDSFADNLQLVLPEGTRWVRGDVWAVFNGSRHTTVNSVALEHYVRSVIALEMSPSWGSSGGMEALKAQAIAARTYTLASKAAHTADTYDVCTSTCQSYGGRKLGTQAIEYPQTDQAVAATAGRVLTVNGSPILAEYSSSSGGYTAAGTSSQPYLAAVLDDGDAIAGNPHHEWTASISVAAIEAKYPAIGALDGIDITGRNGLGDLGGRVTSMVLHGSAGSVTVGGKTFREAFGLKSDWFAVGGAVEKLGGGLGGYFAVGPDGGVFAFGTALFAGSTGAMRLNQPVVGMASRPGGGYWLVAGDGGVFSFGDAVFHGSTGAMRLNQPVVGMAATPSGNGYWLVASDGGIFAFGDAQFFGSTGAIRLNQPVVGMSATPSGGGYWLVASDGGAFAFGDAVFRGSMGGTALRKPLTAMTVTPSGGGYWMLARDGGVFAFGDATYYGSPQPSSVDAVGIAPTASGTGYMVATAAGVTYSYGDAPKLGGVRDVVPKFTGRLIGIAGVR